MLFWFVLGIFIGFYFGIFAMCLMASLSDGDSRQSSVVNRK
jgi:hypothetical protein